MWYSLFYYSLQLLIGDLILQITRLLEGSVHDAPLPRNVPYHIREMTYSGLEPKSPNKDDQLSAGVYPY